MQLQGVWCEAPPKGQTQGSQLLPFAPKTLGNLMRGWHWLGRCSHGRGMEGRAGARPLMARDVQSRLGPARTPWVGPTLVHRVRVNHATGGQGSWKTGPIRGVKVS